MSWQVWVSVIAAGVLVYLAVSAWAASLLGRHVKREDDLRERAHRGRHARRGVPPVESSGWGGWPESHGESDIPLRARYDDDWDE